MEATKKSMDSRDNVKSKITNTLLILMQKKTLDEITITELVQAARVSRMAFYRNFETKMDVIKCFFDNMLEELQQSLGENFEFWDLGYGTAFFSIMKKYGDQILLLHENGLSGLILNSFNTANIELAGDMPFDSIDRFKLYYAAGASYNAAIIWLQNGCKESPFEMADSMLHFMNF